MNLTKSLGLVPGDICCLAGAGGKTSCLYTLACEDPWGSTLATTTTKMRDPRIKEHPFSKIDLGERDSFPRRRQIRPALSPPAYWMDTPGKSKVSQ